MDYMLRINLDTIKTDKEEQEPLQYDEAYRNEIDGKITQGIMPLCAL